MNKIKILSDRIIIDGHADTREQCETATMLANLLLAQGSGFNCVEYRSGYAEFKKNDAVKLADSELKFPPFLASWTITFVWDGNIENVVLSNQYETHTYTASGGAYTLNFAGNYTVTVNCSNGYILDTISGVDYTDKTNNSFVIDASGKLEEQSTITLRSKSATPTLTFKHFYDAGTIGSGTYKFRHYSQQEPSSGETWVLNETIPITSQGSGGYNANFVSNGTTYTYINFDGKPNGIRYSNSTDEILAYSWVDNAWTNQVYRTLTFATPPTGDLLAWLQANGTKQGGATLINFTINGTAYQAEEGMTWEQWCNSSYNTDGYYVREDGVITNNVYFVGTPAGHVSSTDTIVSDYSYAGSGAGGGGIR